jgi:hypothetical protein
MIYASVYFILWLVGLFGGLLSIVACALVGAWIVKRAGGPAWLGAVVGGVFHVAGLAILALGWLIVEVLRSPEEKALLQAERDEAKIKRAVAYLESFGYAVTAPV